MRSLFLRFFLSFWTAMILVLTCTVSATIWLEMDRLHHEQARQQALASQASTVLAAQGMAGLRHWLVREKSRVAPDRLYVLDGHGNDLLGQIVPGFLQAANSGRSWPEARPLHGDVRLLSQLTTSRNETYSLSLLRQPHGPFGIFNSAATPVITALATLSISTILCLILARYLSGPIGHLRAATRAIAAGDLRVRVATLLGRRRDELALLAVDFDAMTERLRTLLDSQRQLLRDVSHELRSPLARLQIALELARRPRANLSQELGRIGQEAQRLDELIGEILSLSRLEDPARELAAEPVNLEELLETLAETARVEAEPRWQRIDLATADLPVIEGDRELLYRAFENVLRNALRFSPSGTQIELSAERAAPAGGSTEPRVLVRVRDRGPGVPEDLLEAIFEPFVRVGQARDRASGGHGIGLAITARVVALHGGSVRAVNVAGGGLQVEIELPVRQPPAQLAEPTPPIEPAAALPATPRLRSA